MPFTFSHPAIVIPLTRLRVKFVSASALVIGSMTPDFEYFIKMKLSGRFSHTLEGAFLFCLPVSFAALVVFHYVVKGPFINALPVYFHSRLIQLRDFDFTESLRKYPFAYFICLLTGIFSHLLWDSFTHANHFMVRHLEFLSFTPSVFFLPSWPLFRYLQHISTLLGAIYLIFYFHHLPSQKTANTLNPLYWLSVILLSSAIYFGRASFGFEYLGDQVSTAISAFFISLIAAGFFTKKIKKYVT
ncbi:MAG: DUF4184 family protein [Cyclobacteriaceae bacterium]|nr:DUF4184 family protein [Cyclobacteriaceae bacterium]